MRITVSSTITMVSLLLAVSVASSSFLFSTVHAADELSPLEQFKQGVPIQDIQCSDQKILVESPRGKPACVVSKTFERLVDRGYTLVVIQNQVVSVQNNTESVVPAIQDDSNTAEHNIQFDDITIKNQTIIDQKIQENIEHDTNDQKTITNKNTTIIDHQGDTVDITSSQGSWSVRDLYHPSDSDADIVLRAPQSNYDKYLDSPEVLEQLRRNTEHNKNVYNTNGMSIGSQMKVQTEGLWKVPNPEGDWHPIENKTDFINRLTAAAGDKFIGIDEYGHFATEKGYMRFGDSGFGYGLALPLENEDDQIAFVDNFMEKMGYKLKIGDDPSITVREWDDTCRIGNTFHHLNDPICNNGKSYISYADPDHDRDGRASYHFLQELSSINFRVIPSVVAPAYNGLPLMKIGSSGWTNHPELIEFPLDQNIALQKAYDFASARPELNIPLDHEGSHIYHCLWQIHNKGSDLIRVDKTLISGVPHYHIEIGYCLPMYGQLEICKNPATREDCPPEIDEYYDDPHKGDSIYFIVDALVGESVFISDRRLTFGSSSLYR